MFIVPIPSFIGNVQCLREKKKHQNGNDIKEVTYKGRDVYPSDGQTLLQRHQYQYACLCAELQESSVSCLSPHYLVSWSPVYGTDTKIKEKQKQKLQYNATIYQPYPELIIYAFVLSGLGFRRFQLSHGRTCVYERLYVPDSGNFWQAKRELICPRGILPYIRSYKPYRYVPPQGVRFLWYTLCTFWSGIGYGFRGNYGSVWTSLSFQFQMNINMKRNRHIRIRNAFEAIFCLRPYLSTLGTRGFSRVQREFSVLAEGRHIFGRRPNSRQKPETALEKSLAPRHGII